MLPPREIQASSLGVWAIVLLARNSQPLYSYTVQDCTIVLLWLTIHSIQQDCVATHFPSFCDTLKDIAQSLCTENSQYINICLSYLQSAYIENCSADFKLRAVENSWVCGNYEENGVCMVKPVSSSGLLISYSLRPAHYLTCTQRQFKTAGVDSIFYQ